MSPEIGIIIQARMGSTRLPGKVLMKIGERPLLEHIFLRIQQLEHSVLPVVATSMNPQDDVLAAFCANCGIDCFRGSELDVLERYFLCTQHYGFTNIIRLTGDNPFTDAQELDNLIRLHIDSRADYSHSFSTLPLGVGAEIFTLAALQTSHLLGEKDNHREHVNEYIQENPDLFQISVLDVPTEKNRPDIRLTVDTEQDYKRACFLVEHSPLKCITTELAIRLCMQFA